MSIRDLLLAILLVFNVYFAYTVYDLNTKISENSVTETTKTEEASKTAKESDNYEIYSTLYMFKQIIPGDVFKEDILPEVETTLKDGTISEAEWANIKLKIEGLKTTKNIDFVALYAENMKETDLKTTLDEMLETMSDGVTNLGSSLKQDLEDFSKKRKESTKNDTDSTGTKTIQTNDKGVTL